MDNRALYKRMVGTVLVTTLVTTCVSFVVTGFRLLPEHTLIVPGLFLPDVKRVDNSAVADEFAQASPGYDSPRLVCATLQFKRTVFFIRESGHLRQVRIAAFPFGYAHIGIRLPVHETRLPPPSVLATKAYLSDYYAVSSGALLVWFDGLQRLSSHPLALFLYLLPQALIFSIACGLARVLVDGHDDWRSQVVLPPLLYWGWIVLATWTMDALFAGAKGDPWRQLVLEVLALGTCALGIGLVRRPWHNVVPKTAIFVLVSLLAWLLANVALAFALATTSRLQVRNDIDMNDINRPEIVQYALALAMGLGDKPPPELESLPAWNEVCPPFRRIVSRGPPASGNSPLREVHP